MRILGFALFPLALAACASSVEEPAYELRLSDGPFEIRRYEPTIVAETTVSGDALGSRFEGFGPLADYIFAKERAGEKIAMTAPVTQAPRAKIAMTAPVTQHASTSDAWTISFTMPAGYTLETLPAPVSPDVTLSEQPARTMAVYSFSGVATEREMGVARTALMQRVAGAGLATTGVPVFAFYDPPWTPSFMRRNEVMIEVEQAS